MYEDLPEHFIDEEGNRIARPVYRMLTQCQVIMASPETGQVGPTLQEPGTVLVLDATPAHQWQPLNRAAGDKMEAWVKSLPLDGKNISQEHINEAAYTLRPREGDPEFPMEAWWPAVRRLAASLADKGRRHAQVVAPGFRPVKPDAPPMPFAAMSSAYPTEAGRAPAAQPLPQNAPIRTRGRPPGPTKPAMPNANVTPTPGQATG